MITNKNNMCINEELDDCETMKLEWFWFNC
jgi:hypothetical protein